MRSAWPDNWLDEANELVGRREGSHWRGAFLALSSVGSHRRGCSRRNRRPPSGSCGTMSDRQVAPTEEGAGHAVFCGSLSPKTFLLR